MKRLLFTFLFLAASVGMSWATTTDLASITGDYTVQDGETLTGTLGVNVKISIADGATVTLLNANINGDKTWTTGDYAGLTCLGDATITIVGKNSVSGFSTENGYPGIYVPSGKTLIINGTGSLTAQSSTEEAAGIGAGRTTHCGNIEIQSGKITAIAGGEEGAGIGGAFNADCGNITISGGIVTAVGGDYSAGIGGGKRSSSTDAGHCGNILISGGVVSATSGKQAAAIGGGRGNNNAYKSNCGTITITNTALKVYAEQGGEKGSTNTIGAGKYNNCGTVTIGGNTGVINDDPYTYRTKEDGEIVVVYINAIGTVVYTQECKDKIDIARELYDALEDSQKGLVTNYQVLLDAEAAYAALIPAAPANSCGGGLTWELNNGELVISYDGTGTGVMNDYDIPNDNPAPWYANRENITSVSLPEGIKTIGKDAFRDCVNLTTVTIPNSVTTIGESAFVTVEHLETVTIGTGITSIVNGAFYGNAELTTVTCSATTPPSIGEMVFDGCTKLTQIFVPTESVDAYKTAWSAYASLISAAGGGSTDVIPCTAADLGKVLCTDGSIYATVSEAAAASKTAAAVIAYVDTENGKALALALADDGEMLWETAKTTAPAHTPAVSGGTWTLASKDDWNNMITAAGGYEALRDGFSGVGGTNMQQDKYWSSTPENEYAWIFYFTYYGRWAKGYVDNPSRVRACLTFNIPAAPAYEKVINLINAIGTVELTAECKANIDAAREAYNALSEGDQALVTNIATLTAAENTYTSLKAAADLTAAAYDLNTLIESAQEDYESVATLPKYASIAEQLLDAINTAKGIAENSEATLSELQTAKTNLQTAYDKFNDDMSGIVTNVDKVNTDASESDVWFDLSGRRLQGKPTTPGLYINNGRKAIVK